MRCLICWHEEINNAAPSVQCPNPGCRARFHAECLNGCIPSLTPHGAGDSGTVLRDNGSLHPVSLASRTACPSCKTVRCCMRRGLRDIVRLTPLTGHLWRRATEHHILIP